jgi:hypothetical protein
VRVSTVFRFAQKRLARETPAPRESSRRGSGFVHGADAGPVQGYLALAYLARKEKEDGKVEKFVSKSS